MSVLEKYSKDELIHIVDMFDIDMKVEDLKKSKKEILKALKDKGVEAKHGEKIPDKKEIKPMVEKDKAKKSSLLNKVKNHKDLKKGLKKKVKDMTPEEKKEYNKLAKQASRAKAKEGKEEIGKRV